MEKELKDIFDKAKNITLENAEKANIKRILTTHAEQIPVRKHGLVRLNKQRSQKYALRLKTMPIALTLILLLSGGTAVAAEGSLPGDFLYPVKTEVNEGVRGWFAVGSEAKAGLHADIAARRLEEAEDLAARGELTEEFRARLESRFEERVELFEAKIGELEADGNVEAAARLSSRLEAELQAHEEILARLDGGEMLSIIAKVRSRLQNAIEARMRAETEIHARADVEVKAAAEGVLVAAENKISEVEKFINQNENRLGADVTAQARARLELAKNTVAEGEVELEAEAYANAFNLFYRAIRIAQEAQLIASAHIRLNVDITPGMFMFRFGEDADVESTNDVDTNDSDSDSNEPADEADISGEGSVDIDAGDGSVDIDVDGEVDILP